VRPSEWREQSRYADVRHRRGLIATLADTGLVAALAGFDEVVGGSSLEQRMIIVFLWRTFAAEADVVADRAVQQAGVLEDGGDRSGAATGASPW
jgi:hypothetical protein